MRKHLVQLLKEDKEVKLYEEIIDFDVSGTEEKR